MACSVPSPWVIPLTLSCTHTLEFSSDTTHESVELLSLTDAYRVTRKALSLDHESGAWSIQVDRSVPHLYLFSVDGQPVQDVHAPLSLEVNGQIWSNLEPLDCSRPQFTFVQREQHQRHTFLTVQLQRATPHSGLDANSIRAEIEGEPLPIHVIDDQILMDITDLPSSKYWLTLSARDKDGRVTQPFSYPFWVESQVFNWSNASLYQVVTDRFAGFEEPAPDIWTIGSYRGGTWAGIEDKIRSGYFTSLGINALWISPINDNPTGFWVGVEGGEPKYEGYHGYWRISNKRINPAFGTPDSLQSLIDTAHDRGIRMILDVVLNHRHRDFNESTGGMLRSNSACICGQSICPWWSDIERCWFTSYLPDVDYGNPLSVTRELSELTDLLKRFDFDGVRVDAVPMMPQFVIRHLKSQMVDSFEGLDSEFLLLGETYTGPSGYDSIRYYLGQHGLDGQFDFPLMWILRSVFAQSIGSTRDLIDAWRTSERAWQGSDSAMANMVGNHDTPRFASVAAQQQVSNPWGEPPEQVTEHHAVQRMLMAQSFLLALPGIWTLYYGDEINLAGAQDPDNRRAYPWTQTLHPTQRTIQSKLQVLGRSRRCLSDGLLSEVDFESASDSGITLVRRDLQTHHPRLIVMIDRDTTAAPASLFQDRPRIQPSERWVDLLTGELFSSTLAGLAVDMNTTGVRWLLPASDPCARAGVW
jgi:glycosidase